MAFVTGVSPILVNQRDAVQSGNKVMTLAWQTVFSASVLSGVVVLEEGDIDLSLILLGDTVEVRVSKVNASGGAAVLIDDTVYAGPMPVGHPEILIGRLVSTYGIIVEMRQTAGVFRTIPTEWFVSKRIGT